MGRKQKERERVFGEGVYRGEREGKVSMLGKDMGLGEEAESGWRKPLVRKWIM